MELSTFLKIQKEYWPQLWQNDSQAHYCLEWVNKFMEHLHHIYFTFILDGLNDAPERHESERKGQSFTSQVGLRALGWEISGEIGGEARGGRGLGRGRTSVEYKITESNFHRGHFLQVSRTSPTTTSSLASLFPDPHERSSPPSTISHAHIY